MAIKYTALPATPLNAGSSFAHPPEPPALVHIDDPALDVMIDLKQMNAITISPDATLPEAAMEMRVCHTHILLVINKVDNVVGMIASEDILGEKPLRITTEKRLRRSEIPVRMVMTPQEKIVAINIEELQSPAARVGNVIETLHQLRQHDALVVEIDPMTNEQTVRGYLSLHQISKQLGKDVTFDLSEAASVSELHTRHSQ